MRFLLARVFLEEGHSGLRFSRRLLQLLQSIAADASDLAGGQRLADREKPEWSFLDRARHDRMRCIERVEIQCHGISTIKHSADARLVAGTHLDDFARVL